MTTSTSNLIQCNSVDCLCLYDPETQFHDCRGMPWQCAGEYPKRTVKIATAERRLREEARNQGFVARKVQERWFFADMQNWLKSSEAGLSLEEAWEWLID